jgi:GT2 family glycosyltransferase
LIDQFDDKAYLKANPDIQILIDVGRLKDALEHLSIGGLEAIEKGLRKFHCDFEPFDEALYLSNFLGIQKAIDEGHFTSGFNHFVLDGYREILAGNRPWGKVLDESKSIVEEPTLPLEENPPLTPNVIINGFDEKAYLKANPDVEILINEGKLKDALEHLSIGGLEEIEKGWRQFHCDFEPFDETHYLKTFLDIQKAIDEGHFTSGFNHFVLDGYREILAGNRPWGKVLDESKSIAEEPILPLKDKSKKKKKKKIDKGLVLLKESGHFNVEYYLENNLDIKEAGVDPLEHYYYYGWSEGRNPNQWFDTLYYLQTNEDVSEAKINPLVHYIKDGEKENRKTQPLKEKLIEASQLVSLFKHADTIPYFETEKPIDIVIPVYNGKEYLEPLFESLVNNTSMPYRLLVCDDKSSDVKVLPLLKKLQKKYKDIDFILLENEKNLGFIGTVNRLSALTQNHFVLQNTDTEVPPFWIERLMYPIFKMQNIASTTPFTNAGTICSFPNYLEDNLIFDNMHVDELDSYFQKVDFENTHIDIPTGVGFCMGVNKDLVDKIGMFDTVFGKGYGEENDWCQRAIKSGYKNLHVPNLFVYHKHGGSFPSEEKKRLIANNSVILNKKHVGFDKQVQTVIGKNELEALRNVLIFKMKSDKNYSALIFDHSLGGGANHYTDEEISRRLSASQAVCLVQYDFSSTKNYTCKLMYGSKEFTFASKSIFDILESLSLFKFDEIFVNSFVSFPNAQDIIKVVLHLQSQNKSKLIVPIHDFFPLCPSYTLLNDKMTYCGVPSDYSDCEKCLIRSQGEFKTFEDETNMGRWRKSWQKLFDVTDEVLCFSNSSKQIFKKAYPSYKEKVIVKPHDISGRYEKVYDSKALKEKEQRIGILGGINEAKGANIVKNLVQYIDDNKLKAKIILIGDISFPIESPSFYKTGRYTIDKLPELVKELKVTEFLIPSIWPETFSYTTDEIMQLGYPLTVFDIGAPAERVCNYALGKVIKMDKLNDILFKNI